MKEAKYIRNGAVIIANGTGETVYFGRVDGQPSINAAKRESRRLQMAADGNALGRGSLRVAE